MARSILRVRIFACCVAMCGLSIVCSCSHERAGRTTAPAPSAAETGGENGPQCLPLAQEREPFQDPAITAAVERQLYKDPGIDAREVKVATRDGIVELTGAVSDLLTKERAWRIAQTVRGVRSVSDRLTVNAPPREDARIEDDVATALALNAATASLPVRATSAQGMVTLTGKAHSWQEEQVAEWVAKGVRGVRGVENRIEVDYLAERTDPEIRADVESRLRWDALLDHRLLAVRVTDGAVSLAGHVGSAAEKWRAASDAWVNGVTSVDESGLDVRAWAERPGLVVHRYPRLSDQEIARAIEDAARYDPRVDPSTIEPQVRAGFVTLRGIVRSLQAKRAAEALARHTVGVVQVMNVIQVRSQLPLEDEDKAQRIRAALAIDPMTEQADIGVEVVDGEAILSGRVDNLYVAAEADRIAAAVHGIRQVTDRLQAPNASVGYAYRRSIGAFGSHFDSWMSGPRNVSGRSDGEIGCDIERELARSAFVDVADVTVTVQDGAATLTGTVDSWKERSAATDRALEAGATAVYNALQVE